MEFVVTLIHDTKKTELFMSSNKLFNKGVLKDNHWVGHLGIKLIDAAAFEKIKALSEVNNNKSKNSEIDILDKGALDKVLEGPGKKFTEKNLKENL